MILVEIGNTTIKVAREVGAATLMLERFASAHDALGALDALRDDPIVVAPVGRTNSDVVLGALRRRGDTHIITPESLASHVGVSYDTPLTLGIDRVLNLLGLPGDGVVISCGTAITVDACFGGQMRWGAIMPGFATAAEGLYERIPTLPRVDIHHQPRLPARTSVDSVTNGIVLATARAAQAIAGELVANHSRASAMQYILTGGDAALLERQWIAPPEPIRDELLLFAGMTFVARSLGVT